MRDRSNIRHAAVSSNDCYVCTGIKPDESSLLCVLGDEGGMFFHSSSGRSGPLPPGPSVHVLAHESSVLS